MRSDDLYKIPDDLPVPVDDGAADHLKHASVPDKALRSTAGELVNLATSTGITVVFCYPRTGRPDEEALGGTENWNSIPGARGCTPQACSYRDSYEELRSHGVKVFGLSTQDTDYQKETAQRSYNFV